VKVVVVVRDAAPAMVAGTSVANNITHTNAMSAAGTGACRAVEDPLDIAIVPLPRTFDRNRPGDLIWRHS